MICKYCENTDASCDVYHPIEMRELPIPNLTRAVCEPVRKPTPEDRMISTHIVYYPVSLYQCPKCKSIDIE